MASNNFTNSFYVFFYAAVVPANGGVASILVAQGHFAVATPESSLVVLGISFFCKIFVANEAIMIYRLANISSSPHLVASNCEPMVSILVSYLL
jgi:hypothetical protein